MAKGIARLGILFLALLITTSAGAATVDESLISAAILNSTAVSDTRGEWFERCNSITEDIYPLGTITCGHDGRSHRIETDLLTLPRHFLTLARNRGSELNGGIAIEWSGLIPCQLQAKVSS